MVHCFDMMDLDNKEGTPVQQTLEGAWLLQEIGERGYAELRHGIPDEQIEEVVNRYADFTLNHPDPQPETMDAMLPSFPTPKDSSNAKLYDKDGFFLWDEWMSKQLDELERSKDVQKEWHKYRTNVNGVGKPDGYTNRSFQEQALKLSRGLIIPPEDPKEYFHFSMRHHVGMVQNHRDYGWGSIPPEVIELGRAFRPIHQKAAQLIIKVAALIEETHPGIRDFFDAPSLATSPVRLLFYHPSESNQLGAGHYDKGALTIQIAESHEGLRVAPNDKAQLMPIVRAEDMAVVFPGYSLRETVGENTPFQPGWHDIIRIDRLNQGRSVPPKAIEVCARYALIFFANGKNFVTPDKTLMHTR